MMERTSCCLLAMTASEVLAGAQAESAGSAIYISQTPRQGTRARQQRQTTTAAARCAKVAPRSRCAPHRSSVDIVPLPSGLCDDKMFFCSISGEPPQDPVVSQKSGQVYERKVKKNPEDAAEEHSRYINLLSSLGPEITQEKQSAFPPCTLRVAPSDPLMLRCGVVGIMPCSSRNGTQIQCLVSLRAWRASPTPSGCGRARRSAAWRPLWAQLANGGPCAKVRDLCFPPPPSFGRCCREACEAISPSLLSFHCDSMASTVWYLSRA